MLESIRAHNPAADIVLAASPIHVEGDAAEIAGKRVLAIEDGPTLTHGEMTYGAAVLAAKTNGAAELSIRRPSRSARSQPPSRSTRTSATCSRRWATAASSCEDLARDDPPLRRRTSS